MSEVMRAGCRATVVYVRTTERVQTSDNANTRPASLVQNNSGRKQALAVRGVKLRKSEQTSRKKQPVRAAAAEVRSIV